MLACRHRLTAHSNLRLHGRCGATVVITVHMSQSWYDGVPGTHAPDAFLRRHPGRLPVGQPDIEFILKLRVAKNHHIKFCRVVHRKAKPDAHFGQDPLDKFKIGFPPLGDDVAVRVFAGKPKFEIRPFQAMRPQHLLYNFRHRLVLEYGAATGKGEQSEARFQRDRIMRLVSVC